MRSRMSGCSAHPLARRVRGMPVLWLSLATATARPSLAAHGQPAALAAPRPRKAPHGLRACRHSHSRARVAAMVLSFDKDAVLEDSFCQVLDEDEYYSSGQRKDSGWFDLVLAVTPVVAPALGGLLYPSIETLYHVVSDVLSFRLWESADGGFAQTQALIPLVNGIVVPACSVALGTLTALTVSQLRQRQIQLRTLLNKEACLIRCILCTFEALFQARCAPPPLHHRRLASPSASITSSSTSARAMSSGPRGGAATPARWKRAVGAARGRCPVSPPWGPPGRLSSLLPTPERRSAAALPQQPRAAPGLRTEPVSLLFFYAPQASCCCGSTRAGCCPRAVTASTSRSSSVWAPRTRSWRACFVTWPSLAGLHPLHHHHLRHHHLPSSSIAAHHHHHLLLLPRLPGRAGWARRAKTSMWPSPRPPSSVS